MKFTRKDIEYWLSKDYSLEKATFYLNYFLENKKTPESKMIFEQIKFVESQYKVSFNEAYLIRNKIYRKLSNFLTIEYWIIKGCAEQEAKLILNQIKKDKRKTNKFCLEYWIENGFTEEEALEKIRNFQKENNDKLQKKKKENPEKYENTYTTKIEYWLEKGFSEEEAKQKLKERQITFTLKKCIEKHGEIEGKKVWQNRQDKWQDTLKSKPQDEIDRMNKSKGLPKEQFIEKHGLEKYIECIKLRCEPLQFNCASNQSLKIFKPIMDYLISKKICLLEDIHIGIEEMNLKEFLIYDEKTKKCYLYDFCVPKLNFVIEFHGEKFHPNYLKMNINEIKKWKSVYGASGIEMLRKDFFKQVLIEERNFKYLAIYSENDIPKNIDICKQFIEDIINEKNN